MKHKEIKNSRLELRLPEKDQLDLEFKSKMFGISKSEIIRQTYNLFWPDKYDPNFIYEKYITASDEDKKNIVKTLTVYIKNNGYPHRKMSSSNLLDEMERLIKTKSVLLDNDLLQINIIGVPIANYFHPHMVKVKCMKNYRTPYEQFKDPALLEDALARLFELNRKPSLAEIRKILKTRDGVRSVSNFRPSISKYIYETYAPNNGRVLDPCAGYGGRLVGLIATRKNLSYHGIDPHHKTCIGNMKLGSFFKEKDFEFKLRLDCGCAEDVMPEINEKFNLIFTSPPYFNTEKYSFSKSQSWVRYPTYDLWRDKFLKVLIDESYRLLEDNSYFIINIKNYKKYPIADDTVQIAKQKFEHVKTYSMKFPNADYSLGKTTWHSEPILVFRK